MSKYQVHSAELPDWLQRERESWQQEKADMERRLLHAATREQQLGVMLAWAGGGLTEVEAFHALGMTRVQARLLLQDEVDAAARRVQDKKVNRFMGGCSDGAG